VVPFNVTVQPAAEPTDEAAETLVRTGRLMLAGRSADFEIRTERRPIGLDLDPEGEILARFYSVQRNPKRVAFYQAQDLAADGDWKAAEQAYRRALREPHGDSDRPALPWMGVADSEVRLLDGQIRLALSRLYLDRYHHAECAEQLREVDELFSRERNTLRMEREVLASRLEIQQGEYQAAYKRLKRTLRLAGERRAPTGSRSLLRQIQLRSERLAMTEAFMLLAVAAYELGHESDARWALEEARERGADVSLLARTLIG
jgi:tetratricopeptide (TPR) repeat protein